jgi:hypothetical protein
MRSPARLTFAALAALAMLALAAPVMAENLPIKFRFDRLTGRKDSTLVTLSTSTIDTTTTIITQELAATVLAPLDTAAGPPISLNSPKSLAVIVEVTGTVAVCESLYLAYDVSEDNGARFYLGKDFVVKVAPVSTASQTWMWFLPTDAADPLSWFWHQSFRLRLKGGLADPLAKCFSTRLWLAWRQR